LLRGLVQEKLVAAAESEVQRREVGKASALAAVPAGAQADDQIEKLWRSVLRCDALYALAWFNLGVGALKSSDHMAAFERFLIAALYVPWDLEAWTNCVIAGLNAKVEASIFGLVITVAYQACGKELYRVIGTKLAAANPERRVAALLERLRILFGHVPPVKQPRTIRVSRRDGSLLVVSSTEVVAGP